LFILFWQIIILFNHINHDFKKLCHMNVDFSLMILYGMWDTHIGHTGEYIYVSITEI
jgi:hypothetical protein